jgi:hypothetical protein
MRAPAVAPIVLAAVLATSACSLLPPRIECGPAGDRATCDRIAAEILARKRAEAPERRIVSLRISDARGSYDLTMDDGMGESVIID